MPTSLESALNSFSLEERSEALRKLAATTGQAKSPSTPAHNLHCHTFFSYNALGLSPSGVAWTLSQLGLSAAGIVDFDVLDAVDEFLDAAQALALPSCAGIETRVFVPELAQVEINSPGEPGIAYHMGTGFVQSQVRNGDFLATLKQRAQERNRTMLERLNQHLDPLRLDYAQDVLPLTPAANPTERHLCAAYAAKAETTLANAADRETFWAEKLNLDPATIHDLAQDPAAFQSTIRAKLMKRGGIGYMAPDGEAFPRLQDFNNFCAGEGAIPTCAWLDGSTDGEADPNALLDLHQAQGTMALNIIPDRNWNIADKSTKRRKVENLHAIVKAAQTRNLPVIIGTEMNAPGQRLVDDFNAPELADLIDEFTRGARILCAHTALQRAAGIGYMSPWATENLPAIADRNQFFAEAGRYTPIAEANHAGLETSATPQQILDKLRQSPQGPLH